MRGKFIVLEGIDGSGKSTQAKKLSSWLETRTNMPTISTYEPNIFRELLLNHQLFHYFHYLSVPFVEQAKFVFHENDLLNQGHD